MSTMSKVYVEVWKNNWNDIKSKLQIEYVPVNSDMVTAVEGFEQMGYEIKYFNRDDLGVFTRALYANNVFVASTDTMHDIFKIAQFNVEHIDYPEPLLPLINRKIRKMTVTQALHEFMEKKNPIFIKPIQTKLFTGCVLNGHSNINYFQQYGDVEVYVSDVIRILSEWRAYIFQEKIIDCRLYKGDYRQLPSLEYLQKIVSAYKRQPISYTLDVAIIQAYENEEFKLINEDLIEVNDFYAISAYGLSPTSYASMLVHRYAQIVTQSGVVSSHPWQKKGIYVR